MSKTKRKNEMVGVVKKVANYEIPLDDLPKARGILEERLLHTLPAPRTAAIEAGIRLLDRLVESNRLLTGLTEQIREMEEHEKSLRAEVDANMKIAVSAGNQWRDAENNLHRLKEHCAANGLPLPEGMAPIVAVDAALVDVDVVETVEEDVAEHPIE